MSGRLVSVVLESALPAWLKPYAVAFASFAADDGSKVYPGVARVARMVGRTKRQTQKAIAELRRRRILSVVVPSTHDAATRYHLHAERLPTVADGEQIDLFSNVSQFPQRKYFDFGTKTGFPQISTASTCNPRHPRGVVGDTRSVIDPSITKRTRARARKTGT